MCRLLKTSKCKLIPVQFFQTNIAALGKYLVPTNIAALGKYIVPTNITALGKYFVPTNITAPGEYFFSTNITALGKYFTVFRLPAAPHRSREAAVNRWRLISMPWTRSSGNPHKTSINLFS